jgi:hypothetical protein
MAEPQTWWLARDSGWGSEYVISEYPLVNHGKARQIDWMPEDPHKWNFVPIDEETWNRLTKGECVLEPGQPPLERELLLTVKERG